MAVVGEEGKASGSRRMAAHHRKRMDDALPTKHKPAEAGKVLGFRNLSS